MAEKDLKRLARQHIDLVWNKGHLALAEQLHSPDFLYKSAFTAQPLNNAGYRRLVEGIRSAMPDLEVVVEECIREGNKVFTWSTLLGSISRPAFGYPASEKILSLSAMGFWVFSSTGEILELCTMFDMESFRAQMGLQNRPFAEKALP
ncbi:ketosteroid isomerase-related protein [Pseudomonas sp. QE6]|uniref:ketosteroid isomerase-related protein n=1 Tax=unclassified Pseudomonas TaxID=196821 RepID=UPI001FB6FE90|nr:ketosteroid isomerase-related protein [Pseudomonas sp. LA21]MCJ1885733.1 ester cyclase [Pseudomonas sp. LA21]